ncbi:MULTISPECIES: hypothetical protein [unclassified Streptomyces]|uniref:zinc finger domain-containing protein n=1 Tax=unclassified Streptomyces TaxID=2593676 RepID=UPI0033B9A143
MPDYPPACVSRLQERAAAEPSTDGVESSQDAARRFARRLRAVEQLCAGRPGYHAITVKALLTAMGEAGEEGQEPPFLDPFTEAAVRRGALLGGADAIEALPEDHECDPGRGDAVKLLRRLASLTATTEQPTGLTWEARAEHAVRLYAITAIELEDARRENTQLRDRLAKLEQGQADADHLAAEHPDTIASLLADLADDLEPLLPHGSARAYAVAGLARYTRLLAAEARERLAERSAEMRADGYRGRVAWCSGMSEVAKLLDARADALAPEPAAPVPQPAAAAAEQPLAFPQLAVPCPRCGSPAKQLCTSHGGTRQRTNDTHQDRTKAYRATQAGR